MDPIRPPKSLLFQGFVKSVGIFFLGLAALVSSLTAAIAVDTARDTLAESRCRSELATETSRLEGQINATGWSSVLNLRKNPSPEATERAVKEMTRLTEAWHRAQERRDNANEICKE